MGIVEKKSLETTSGDTEHYWSNRKKEIKTLRKNLSRYGQHLPACARRIAYEKMDDSEPYYFTKCDCGWYQIMKELE